MLQPRTPSRILNDTSIFLGLSFGDLIGIACLLGALQVCLKPFGKEAYALAIAGLSLLLLIPVRTRYRRKVLRDSIRFVVEGRSRRL